MWQTFMQHEVLWMLDRKDFLGFRVCHCEKKAGNWTSFWIIHFGHVGCQYWPVSRCKSCEVSLSVSVSLIANVPKVSLRGNAIMQVAEWLVKETAECTSAARKMLILLPLCSNCSQPHHISDRHVTSQPPLL